VKWTPDFGPAA